MQHATGHIHIFGIGLELACSRSSFEGISLKRDKCHFYLKILPTLASVPSYSSSPIPKRMFFFNALQLWKNISDKDFVYSTDLKFKRNYLDCIMRKFTPDSFKTNRIF